MSSRNKVGRSAATGKNIRFAAARKNNRSGVAHKNDHAPLCLFTFSDGRRCRTPRTGNLPHFCFDHAQKEARGRTAEAIGKDLANFFSADYLSANDLSAALARLIPAVVRGDIKPRTARTIAYLAQTLLQTIRLAQQEYINAFGTNGWRNAIANSVNGNHDYLFPPPPPPHPSPAQAPAVAGLQTGAVPAPQPAAPPISTPVIPNPIAPFANGGGICFFFLRHPPTRSHAAPDRFNASSLKCSRRASARPACPTKPTTRLHPAVEPSSIGGTACELSFRAQQGIRFFLCPRTFSNLTPLRPAIEPASTPTGRSPRNSRSSREESGSPAPRS